MKNSSFKHSRKRIMVIGNGMTGHKFCEKLKEKDTHNQFIITVLSEEQRRAYDRVHLSNYFSEKRVDNMYLCEPGWYKDQNIQLCLGESVAEIDKYKKNIISSSGNIFSYDYLVIATGSSPFIPSVPGTDLFGIHVYRTIEDLELIMAHAYKSKKATVIGGGLLGLEAAKAMLDLNMETHVVEFSPRLMPRQLDETGAGFLKTKLEHIGIQIHLNKNTVAFRGRDKIESIEFADHTELETDMAVISAGIRPRDELARQCGLKIGPRGGIMVNEHLQTSDPCIYAIGECALFEGMIYGLVAPGYEMAEVVASLLTGVEKTFHSFDMSTKLKLIGVDVASFGDPFGMNTAHNPVIFEDRKHDVYKRINISEDGKTLLGGILVGDAQPYNMLLQTYRNGLALPHNLENILFEIGNKEGKNGGGIMELPGSALICSCENISKETICNAVVNQGVTDIEGMKKCTKAGTGCGGCIPFVKDLINETLKLQGKAVKQTLCEHFDYSRQELYELIRVKEIKTFDNALQSFGHGAGCEICKPAIASILASAWNDLIIRQATIQDTNDRYLANIQKGGSYSVVPRIPGGEITPEKLIAIGQIAQKYNLYCKITGGQRIDLFGALVHQLPQIWEDLIAAGFESGHAYGKAVRTVKSCVGSTWCRYGLHDSVGFAIELEERYKGLRSPHKIKMAVSGCIRECAEAQAKDIGVIATEKGWNLFVCGNGGAKPQHAVLFASNIDKETVIRYIDRLLMFYIKTAEPLTRTATWLNKMEGGLEHLKKVVIDDELGICDALEKEMKQTLDQYYCEWKAVVENPELRKQFTHFVNSGDPDPTIQFNEIRKQKVPASWE
ncbi:MAG: nitrite reductase large subunit [Chitinophagaceae bacterium]|nr:MAG: nitrite reductase large subunit [Chitinophagaceae bacterium]